jgi:hypothetical protein
VYSHSNRHVQTATSSTTTPFFQQSFHRRRTSINLNLNLHMEIRETNLAINNSSDNLNTSESANDNKLELSLHHTDNLSVLANLVAAGNTTEKPTTPTSSPSLLDVKRSVSDLPAIRAFTIDCSVTNNIDASGLQMLLDVKAELTGFAGGLDRPFEMHFVNVKRQILGVLEHPGITSTVVPGLDVYEESTSLGKSNQNDTSGRSTSISDDLRRIEGRSAFVYDAHIDGSTTVRRMSMSPLVNQRHHFVHYSVADAVHAVQRANHTSST